MYNDDSRGLESPDRRYASTADHTTRVRTDGGTDPEDTQASPNPDFRERLSILSRQATHLLAEILESGALDDRTRREAARHVREVCSETACVRLALYGVDGLSPDAEPYPDLEPWNDGLDVDVDADGHDDIPMVVDRGPLVTVCHGPDPVAFERAKREGRLPRDRNGDASEDGESTSPTDADVPEDGASTTDADRASTDGVPLEPDADTDSGEIRLETDESADGELDTSSDSNGETDARATTDETGGEGTDE